MRVQFEARWIKAHGPKMECDYRIAPCIIADYAVSSIRLAILLDKRRAGCNSLGTTERLAKQVRDNGWTVHVIGNAQQLSRVERLVRIVSENLTLQ